MEALSWGALAARAALAFWPVWLALGAVFAASLALRGRLGLYGRLFESRIAMLGLGLVLFWTLSALMAGWIGPYDPLAQMLEMKNAPPGSLPPGGGPAYLFGGDNLGRDVFSRMVHGGREVLSIAPAATAIAFTVGAVLGLPAGYFGGRIDTGLSFLANLVLAFPVILLFYLLVTPEIRRTAIPLALAAVLFLFPLIFCVLALWSRWAGRPAALAARLVPALLLGGWAYAGLAFDADPLGWLGMDANLLNVFAAVVFVNAPTVFRIVRGLTFDIKTRGYVAAAQTRGEGAWYVMLWEILPNARGPLIVDFCLRMGYTTILLGTLGFFGLGVSPESPDWGSTINEGRRLLSIHPHPALPPALALISLVLGLNLLADGLREQAQRN